jgi:hypothetical protein
MSLLVLNRLRAYIRLHETPNIISGKSQPSPDQIAESLSSLLSFAPLGLAGAGLPGFSSNTKRKAPAAKMGRSGLVFGRL